MSQQTLPAQSAQAQQKVPAMVEQTNRMIGYIQAKQDDISMLLGGKESFDRFKSVVLTAIHKTPELVSCDPKSFVDSCLACASDGLVPDGRRAALVSFNDRQNNKKVCQYLPMIRGVIECMHRTGYVKDVQQDVVYKGEPFVYKKGLNPILDHEPQPDLRSGDVNIIWAYAVVTTVNGGSYALAMTRAEIDKIRAISKTDKVWKPFFAEMAKKTVLRNLSKNLPFDLDVFRRDDAMYDLDKATAPVHAKTAQLTHNPADVIEPEDPAPKPEPRQETRGADSKPDVKNEARAQTKPAAAASVLDDDDIPAHIRDAPPLEGEVVKSVREKTMDAYTEKPPEGALNGTVIIDEGKSEAPVAHPIVAKVAEMRNWTHIDVYLQQLWRSDEWFAIEDAGEADAVLLAISKLPVFEFADDGTLSYSRIKLAVKDAE